LRFANSFPTRSCDFAQDRIKIINEQSNVNMTEIARSKIETFPIRRRKILEQFDLVAAGCFLAQQA